MPTSPVLSGRPEPMPAQTPRRRPRTHPLERAQDELEHEIIAEKAATLGRMGRRLEASLRRLSEDKTHDGEELIARVAHDAWCYIVQREVCGLRDHRSVIDEFGIPPKALARMGVVGQRPAWRRQQGG